MSTAGEHNRAFSARCVALLQQVEDEGLGEEGLQIETEILAQLMEDARTTLVPGALNNFDSNGGSAMSALLGPAFAVTQAATKAFPGADFDVVDMLLSDCDLASGSGISDSRQILHDQALACGLGMGTGAEEFVGARRGAGAQVALKGAGLEPGLWGQGIVKSGVISGRGEAIEKTTAVKDLPLTTRSAEEKAQFGSQSLFLPQVEKQGFAKTSLLLREWQMYKEFVSLQMSHRTPPLPQHLPQTSMLQQQQPQPKANMTQQSQPHSQTSMLLQSQQEPQANMPQQAVPHPQASMLQQSQPHFQINMLHRTLPHLQGNILQQPQLKLSPQMQGWELQDHQERQQIQDIARVQDLGYFDPDPSFDPSLPQLGTVHMLSQEMKRLQDQQGKALRKQVLASLIPSEDVSKFILRGAERTIEQLPQTTSSWKAEQDGTSEPLSACVQATGRWSTPQLVYSKKDEPSQGEGGGRASIGQVGRYNCWKGSEAGAKEEDAEKSDEDGELLLEIEAELEENHGKRKTAHTDCLAGSDSAGTARPGQAPSSVEARGTVQAEGTEAQRQVKRQAVSKPRHTERELPGGPIKARSMTEKRRRDRISKGLKQLRMVVQAQGDSASVLEQAVTCVKGLQDQVKELQTTLFLHKAVCPLSSPSAPALNHHGIGAAAALLLPQTSLPLSSILGPAHGYSVSPEHLTLEPFSAQEDSSQRHSRALSYSAMPSSDMLPAQVVSALVEHRGTFQRH